MTRINFSIAHFSIFWHSMKFIFYGYIIAIHNRRAREQLFNGQFVFSIEIISIKIVRLHLISCHCYVIKDINFTNITKRNTKAGKFTEKRLKEQWLEICTFVILSQDWFPLRYNSFARSRSLIDDSGSGYISLHTFYYEVTISSIVGSEYRRLTRTRSVNSTSIWISRRKMTPTFVHLAFEYRTKSSTFER